MKLQIGFPSILFCCILTASCTNHTKTQTAEESLLHLDPRQSEFENSNRRVTTKVVALETNMNSMFGYISDIDFNGDGIVIFDQYKTQDIFLFTRDGRFVRSFVKKGKGPGEIQYPKCFAVDWANELIDIFDIATHTMFQFDFVGGIKSSYEVGFPIQSFIKLDSSNYLLNLGNQERVFFNSKLISNNLIFFNAKKGIYNQMDPITKTGAFYSSSNVSLRKSKADKVFYYNITSPNIYLIEDEGLTIKWTLDFDKLFLPSELAEDNADNFVQFFNSEAPKLEYVYGIPGIWEIGNHICVTYIRHKKIYIAFFDKDSGELCYKKEWNSLTKELFGVSNVHLLGVFENQIVCSVAAIEVLSSIKDCTIMTGFFSEHREVLSHVNENDNPLILSFTINF